MISRWSKHKPTAVALRREGNSIGVIEEKLGIPRSTLSGWFRSVQLTEKQQLKLKQRSDQGLIRARVLAAEWHNTQRNARIDKAAQLAEKTLGCLPDSLAVSELALAFLYLGEGAKTKSRTSLGSSDIRIARFFVRCLREVYDLSDEYIKCYLHLRADQDSDALKSYWSKELKIPLSNFRKSSIDIRTMGKPTYSTYKGVCVIECGKVEIQRRLMYIANSFCDRIGENRKANKRG